MKFGEHEYKVMGLAPYARPAATGAGRRRAGRGLRPDRGRRRATFAWRRRGSRYRVLLEATLGLRASTRIAGGAQRVVEESLLRWAGSCASATAASGSRSAAACLHEREGQHAARPRRSGCADLFVFPSCGDESNAVGAAYLGYLEPARASGTRRSPQPFGPAYLGPLADDAEAEARDPQRGEVAASTA